MEKGITGYKEQVQYQESQDSGRALQEKARTFQMEQQVKSNTIGLIGQIVGNGVELYKNMYVRDLENFQKETANNYNETAKKIFYANIKTGGNYADYDRKMASYRDELLKDKNKDEQNAINNIHNSVVPQYQDKIFQIENQRKDENLKVNLLKENNNYTDQITNLQETLIQTADETERTRIKKQIDGLYKKIDNNMSKNGYTGAYFFSALQRAEAGERIRSYSNITAFSNILDDTYLKDDANLSNTRYAVVSLKSQKELYMKEYGLSESDYDKVLNYAKSYENIYERMDNNKQKKLDKQQNELVKEQNERIKRAEKIQQAKIAGSFREEEDRLGLKMKNGQYDIDSISDNESDVVSFYLRKEVALNSGQLEQNASNYESVASLRTAIKKKFFKPRGLFSRFGEDSNYNYVKNLATRVKQYDADNDGTTDFNINNDVAFAAAVDVMNIMAQNGIPFDQKDVHSQELISQIFTKRLKTHLQLTYNTVIKDGTEFVVANDGRLFDLSLGTKTEQSSEFDIDPKYKVKKGSDGRLYYVNRNNPNDFFPYVPNKKINIGDYYDE
jgi:hypothetical protein